MEENQKEGLRTLAWHKANASRFHFSVGSFSIVSTRIEKGNFMFVFFEQLKVLNTHRLLAVKYYTHVSFYHRIEQQFGTRF